MDALLVYPDLCAHKICIADGLPDPYRDPRTRTGATVSPRGIESPSLYCVDIALGHLHRCLQGAQLIGSGLFLDSVRMLSRSWISSQYSTGGWISSHQTRWLHQRDRIAAHSCRSAHQSSRPIRKEITEEEGGSCSQFMEGQNHRNWRPPHVILQFGTNQKYQISLQLIHHQNTIVLSSCEATCHLVCPKCAQSVEL